MKDVRKLMTLLLNNSKALLTRYNKVDILKTERKLSRLFSLHWGGLNGLFTWNIILSKRENSQPD